MEVWGYQQCLHRQVVGMPCSTAAAAMRSLLQPSWAATLLENAAFAEQQRGVGCAGAPRGGEIAHDYGVMSFVTAIRHRTAALALMTVACCRSGCMSCSHDSSLARL